MKPMTKDLQLVRAALDGGKDVTVHWGTLFPDEIQIGEMPDVVSLDIARNKITVKISRRQTKEYDILPSMAFDIEE